MRKYISSTTSFQHTSIRFHHTKSFRFYKYRTHRRFKIKYLRNEPSHVLKSVFCRSTCVHALLRQSTGRSKRSALRQSSRKSKRHSCRQFNIISSQKSRSTSLWIGEGFASISLPLHVAERNYSLVGSSALILVQQNISTWYSTTIVDEKTNQV